MILSCSEFDLLVSAFQSLIDSLPPDPETDLICDQTEAFLSRLDSQPGYRLTPGEVENCIIALQRFCANSAISSTEPLALLQRFLSLRFRSF